MVEAEIIEAPIDAGRLMERATDPACGAVACFVGTARRSSIERPDEEVVRLEYEAYVPMARVEMLAIASEAAAIFHAPAVIVHHRVGALSLGQAAVAVVVSTAHRAEAFDACRYVIEELKKRVPIWKKEVFVDGSEWVNARP